MSRLNMGSKYESVTSRNHVEGYANNEELGQVVVRDEQAAYQQRGTAHHEKRNHAPVRKLML